MAGKEHPVEATTIVQNVVMLLAKHVLWKKILKMRKKNEKKWKKSEKMKMKKKNGEEKKK